MIWVERAKTYFSQKLQGRTDETSKTHVSSVSSVGVDTFFQNNRRILSVLAVGGATLLQKPVQPVNNPSSLATNPDRWCWPHSEAMSGTEVTRMLARLALFTRRGLAANQADALADKLKSRDREGDDRRACIECQRLSASRTCTVWRQTGIGRAQIGPLLATLQRCPSFVPAAAPGSRV